MKMRKSQRRTERKSTPLLQRQEYLIHINAIVPTPQLTLAHDYPEHSRQIRATDMKLMQQNTSKTKLVPAVLKHAKVHKSNYDKFVNKFMTEANEKAKELM
jgi:hypothetical protein